MESCIDIAWQEVFIIHSNFIWHLSPPQYSQFSQLAV